MCKFILKNLAVLKNLFSMLEAEHLRLLTIDIPLLSANLRHIVAACLETVLPRFLRQPGKLALLSKLHRQFHLELARFSGFTRPAEPRAPEPDGSAIKQTICLLKSIKLVIGKLKLARRRGARAAGEAQAEGGAGGQLDREQAALDRKVRRGIELMGSGLPTRDTFSGPEYGAKNGGAGFWRGKENYNMDLQATAAGFAEREGPLPPGDLRGPNGAPGEAAQGASGGLWTETSEGPGAKPQKRCTRCTCKNSRCLKMYCECLKSGGFCGPMCICVKCHNKGPNPERARAISRYRAKKAVTESLASKRG